MKFGMITTCGAVAYYYTATPIPRPKESGPHYIPIFGTSYVLTHSMRDSYQFLHGNQTVGEESFYTVDNEC